MTIELKKGNYFYAFYFISNKRQDLMGAIWKEDKTPDKIFMEYRFRYYKDDKTFDSKDTKNWYNLSCKPEGLEKLIELTQFICDAYANEFKCDLKEFIFVNGDHEVLADILKTKKWVDMHWEEKEGK